MFENEQKAPVFRLAPDQLDQIAVLVADKLQKSFMPVKDRLSQREAYRLYGAGWIQKMVLIDPSIRFKRGGIWQYSKEKLDILNSMNPHMAPRHRRRKSKNDEKAE